MGGVFEDVIESVFKGTKDVIDKKKKADEDAKKAKEKKPAKSETAVDTVTDAAKKALKAEAKNELFADVPVWAWVLVGYLVIKGLK
jgi:hypothetical protein